ncbi:MAG: alpha/beta hydrolase [Gammaproteobacteria bacterium]|nr:alpha/beta hydrolase [Gammaproteobacteria bacterium]
MPTPIIYEVNEFGPLDGIPPDEHWNLRRVYYATTRTRDDDLQRIDYSNTESDEVSIGMSLIGFGNENMTWEDLSEVSRRTKRDSVVPLSVAGIMEVGRYPYDSAGPLPDKDGATNWLMADISESIDSSRDKDILIYVHGAKVNFYNASVFAAQLDHFMGRDMTSIAFSWPTRQNIFAYVMGDDKERAYRAATALNSLIILLAEKTDARRINILTWSAGGRLVASALAQLRELHPKENSEQLSARYHLGVVYFAAADVPGDEFIEALPAMNDLAQRVVVTGSSKDDALESARIFMGGSTRVGQSSIELSDEQRETVLRANRLEYVNLSKGHESRGFDITGHRYWFNHPWASSDVLLAIRTDLDPAERGLQQSDLPLVWWMPDDYPERLKRVRQFSTDELRR